MPPTSLPTPAPSSEILPGRKTSLTDYSFALPPAAMTGRTSESPALTSPSPVNSDSSYRPLSPPGYAASRKTTAAAKRKSSGASVNTAPAGQAQNAYTLPPPPTRSRKIIQMKPRGQQGDQESASAATTKVSASASGAATAQSTAPMKASPAGKRKQGGGNPTSASRKIARKTAHSLIERRRRSKMNEEFGVLKDMIPACRGQEMHKLAILQASIEYMRYLEQCLGDLKTAHSTQPSITHERLPSLAQLGTRDLGEDDTPTADNLVDMDEDSSEEEMSEVTSPHPPRPHSAAASSVPSNRPSASPAILPSSQTSPEIMSKHAMYGFVYHSAQSSALPSPAFEPHTKASGPGYTSFALTSPALGPQRDDVKALERDDHEATAALLMLNTDRRSWSGPGGGRGMSVKDLLG